MVPGAVYTGLSGCQVGYNILYIYMYMYIPWRTLTSYGSWSSVSRRQVGFNTYIYINHGGHTLPVVLRALYTGLSGSQVGNTCYIYIDKYLNLFSKPYFYLHKGGVGNNDKFNRNLKKNQIKHFLGSVQLRMFVALLSVMKFNKL